MITTDTSYQIIFENESIIVVNKPTGCHSVPGEDPRQTVVDYLRQAYPQNFSFDSEGGLLQRLDYQTSGCLMIAKSQSAYDFFKQQIKEHKICKEYLLISDRPLLENKKSAGFLYSRHRGSKKISISQEPLPRALFAETIFRPERSISDSLHLIRAQTYYGRRHQVRVQAADQGITLLGDNLYGSSTTTLAAGLNNFPQFLLHAEKVILPTNSFCQENIFQASLPVYLADLLKSI